LPSDVDGCRRVCVRPPLRQTRKADLERERKEIKADEKGERNELAAIYVGRGLDLHLPNRSPTNSWRMTRSARTHVTNSASRGPQCTTGPGCARVGRRFATGAALPLLVAVAVPEAYLLIVVPATSLVFLALLGGWLRARAAQA